MRKYLGRALLVLMMVAIVGLAGYAKLSPHAAAGPQIVGNPVGATSRVLFQQSGEITRIEYVATGVKTMQNTTPVTSDAWCGNGTEDLYRADVVLSGTMTGTAPTLAVKWQNSIDGGTNWVDVGTWTTINATVTPASQSQVVSDVQNATTAIAYGDCWRVTYTWGGTGTVTANFTVKGIAE